MIPPETISMFCFCVSSTITANILLTTETRRPVICPNMFQFRFMFLFIYLFLLELCMCLKPQLNFYCIHLKTRQKRNIRRKRRKWVVRQALFFFFWLYSALVLPITRKTFITFPLFLWGWGYWGFNGGPPSYSPPFINI